MSGELGNNVIDEGSSKDKPILNQEDKKGLMDVQQSNQSDISNLEISSSLNQKKNIFLSTSSTLLNSQGKIEKNLFEALKDDTGQVDFDRLDEVLVAVENMKKYKDGLELRKIVYATRHLYPVYFSELESLLGLPKGTLFLRINQLLIENRIIIIGELNRDVMQKKQLIKSYGNVAKKFFGVSPLMSEEDFENYIYIVPPRFRAAVEERQKELAQAQKLYEQTQRFRAINLKEREERRKSLFARIVIALEREYIGKIVTNQEIITIALSLGRDISDKKARIIMERIENAGRFNRTERGLVYIGEQDDNRGVNDDAVLSFVR